MGRWKPAAWAISKRYIINKAGCKMRKARLVSFTFILLTLVSYSLSAADQLAKVQLLPNPVTFNWYTLPNTPVACNYCAGSMFTYDKIGQICGKTTSGSVYPYIQFYQGGSWQVGTVPHPGGGVWGHSASQLYAWTFTDVIVSGGATDSGYYNYTTDYKPSLNTWTQNTPMPQPNMIYTAMQWDLSGNLYLIGGQLGQGGMVLSTLYRWKPGDAAMTQLASMPAPRCAAAVEWGPNGIFVFGGSADGINATDTIFFYYVNGGTWTTMSAHLGTPRMGASAAFAGNMLYIFGGKNGGQYLSSVECYDYYSGMFIAGPTMPYPSAFHACSHYEMSNPKNRGYWTDIYLTGGSNQTGVLNNACRAYIVESDSKVTPTSLGNIKALFH